MYRSEKSYRRHQFWIVKMRNPNLSFWTVNKILDFWVVSPTDSCQYGVITCICHTHHSGIGPLRPGTDQYVCQIKKHRHIYEKCSNWRMEFNLLFVIWDLSMLTSSSKNLHISQKYFPMQAPQLEQFCCTCQWKWTDFMHLVQSKMNCSRNTTVACRSTFW